MVLVIAYAAAIGCSLCNGISTVQQKIGADHESRVRSLDVTFLFRLYRNGPYAFGTILELIGYILSLVSLQVLPLFLVQSVIAASIVVTAFGERLFMHRRLSLQTYLALGIVLVGLILLALSAVSGHAIVSSPTTKLLIELLPIPLAALGLYFIYDLKRKRLSAIILAAIAGLAFGNTSTIGRILIYPHPIWKIIENPLLLSLVISAVLGQYFFTVSLQRASATKSNAVMIALQTLGPAACGLLFFDDRIRAGFETTVLLGTVLVIVGSALTAIDGSSSVTI
jgi:drug/metabolite transporter (DMT)-like permease